ncbi:MAG: ROK family protein [Actinomycetes bacterium]|jgi:polyphosphate glucokinase|nr:ROK family protein [Acidimicrobiia bacterium]
MPVLGIDIGGSGIKANVVDLDLGEPVGKRLKVATPQPSTPEAVAGAVADLVKRFDVDGPIGCTFPAVVLDGVTMTAANVDESWIGTDAAALFREALGRPVTVVNDADAAGLAEMSYGAGKGREGVVICLTFGTGIGSALFTHGVLVPNTEFGHLHFRGFESVEDWAAASARDREKLSWEEWGSRVDEYLRYLERIFTPDLMIIGGGVSRRFDQFADYIHTRCEVVPAKLRNEAGIVGAAMAAAAAK